MEEGIEDPYSQTTTVYDTIEKATSFVSFRDWVRGGMVTQIGIASTIVSRR